jgi:hypothetical protein
MRPVVGPLAKSFTSGMPSGDFRKNLSNQLVVTD